MRTFIILSKVLLLGILSFYIVFMFIFGTTTFADALRGYETMQQFINGGAWNTLAYPSTENNSYSYFVAWWAPGQWMIPYLLKVVFGVVSFQVIQTTLIILCLFTSLYGYRKLFLILNFKKPVIYGALLCIVTNQLFYWHTLMYYGGDLLLQSLFPFFIILLIQLKGYKFIYKWITFILICLVGVYFKNTFLVLLLCGISFSFFRNQSTPISSRIKQSLPLLFTFGIIYLTTYFFLLKNGATPASSYDLEGYSSGENNILNDLSFALGSPAGILTRITFFIQKAANYFSNWELLFTILKFIPLLLTAFFLFDYKKFGDRVYYKLLLFFCVPFLLFFVFMYLQDRAVSYEMRHFAAISFLFFPGFIKWISSFKGNYIWFTILAFVCIIDLGMYIKSATKINSTYSMWNDLKLPKEDVEMLNLLSEWDRNTENGLLLISDYWQLNIGVRKNDKLVFQEKDDATIVMSGMELNQPDTILINNQFINKYNEILLITSQQKSTNLNIDHYDFEHIKETERFIIRKIEKNASH